MLAGCEGHYRYPCQDPANWDKKECNNEICSAEGSCTDDVLGKKHTAKTSLEQNLQTDDIELSNSEMPDDSVKLTKPKGTESKRVNTEENDTSEINQETLDRNVLDASDAEPELTMDTVVETAEHNEATK
jgi:hypothetical protein